MFHLNKGLFFRVSDFGNIMAYHLTPQNMGVPISSVMYLRYFDSSFYSIYNKDFISIGGQCAINDSFSLLIAGYDTNDIKTMSLYSLYYIKGSYVNSYYKSYTFNSVKKIKLNNNPFGSNYILISRLKYNFIIGFKDSIYIVRPNYTIKNILPERSNTLLSTFQYNNDFYILTIRANNVEYEIFKSSDDGETWTLEFILTGIRLDAIINVSNILIAKYRDLLSRVLIKNDGSMELIELKRDGLETKKIRDICLWNGKVWVATNAGIFYKDYSDFINNK